MRVGTAGLFVSAAVLWGVPYVLAAAALDEVSPAFTVFARAVLGAAILVPLALHRGVLGHLRGRKRQLLWLALLDLTVPALCITVGLTRIPSSLAGILIASVPILVAILALIVDHTERAAPPQAAGLVLGLGGVALLLGVEVSADAQVLIGGLLVLAGAVSYAGGALYYKRRLADLPPLAVVCGTLIGCALMSAVPAAASLPTAPSVTAIGSLLALGVGCTGFGYVAFYSLIARLGATRAAVITYIAPAIAVLAGVLLRSEPITAASVAGLLLILAGAYLATGGRPPAPMAAVPPCYRDQGRADDDSAYPRGQAGGGTQLHAVPGRNVISPTAS